MASAPSASRSSEGPTRASASVQSAADITALSTRDDFLLELGQALGAQGSIQAVSSLAAALEQMASGRRLQILALDARCVPDMRAAIDNASTKIPRAVLMVFATSTHESQIRESLRGTPAFALLPMPIDPQATQEAFAEAIAQSAPRPAPAPPVRPPPPPPATPRVTPPASADPPPAARVARAVAPESRPEPPRFSPAITAAASIAASARPTEEFGTPFGGSSAKKWMLIGAAAAVMLAAAGLWLFLPKHGSPAPAESAATATEAGTDVVSVPAPSAETTLLQGKVDDLLEKARLAIRERRFAEPVGDNALVYYRSAAAADPKNDEARDGLQRVAGVLEGRFTEALGAGKLDEAALALANFKAAASGEKFASARAFEQRLYSAEVSKALADGAYERAGALVRQAQQSGAIGADQIAKWRAEIARREEERAQRPGARGAATKPAEARGKAGEPQGAATAELVRTALREERLSEPADSSAAHYLTELQSTDPQNAELIPLSHELAGKFLERARTEVAAGKSADADLAQAKRFGADPKDILAAQSSAKPARTDPARLAATLKPIKAPPPDYPDQAVNLHISGSVIVSYTVDTKGETRDVKVVEAKPPGVFERAAINAVKRWRYAPVLVNGVPVEVPTKTLVRFELPK